MSINEGKPVRLSRSWRTKDNVTIPAGTEIRVTEEQERELREGGFLEDLNAPHHGCLTSRPAEDEEDDEMFFSYGSEEPDEQFLDVHRDNTGD